MARALLARFQRQLIGITVGIAVVTRATPFGVGKPSEEKETAFVTHSPTVKPMACGSLRNDLAAMHDVVVLL